MAKKLLLKGCLAFMEGSHTPQSALEKWNTRTMDYVAARSDREVNIDGENL